MNTDHRFLFCLIVVVLISSCWRPEYHKPFQEQPLVSPSGKYVLTLPIEKAADTLHYWRVTISDRNGNVLFKDDSEFPGRFNVYWTWDNADRVWLQNSDNGYTYYWKLDDENHWRRYQCNQGNPESLPCSLSPIKLGTHE